MCRSCQIKPVYEFTNKRKLCKTCFIKYFQKKALYTIRKFKMISKGEKVGYENNGDFRGAVLEHVLKIYADKAKIELMDIKNKKINKIDKVAIPSTLDLQTNKIISILIKGDVGGLNNIKPIIKDKKKNKKSKYIIKPLYLFLDAEVLLYARLRGLTFKEQRVKKLKKDKIEGSNRDMIWMFLDNLEKKHPEIKRAVVNSYLEMFG